MTDHVDDAAGADGYNKQPQGLTKDQKRKEKYGDDVNNFSVSGNSSIKDGAVRDRSCTDFMCLIVFLVFLGAMMAATIYGFKHGELDKYMAPLDKDSNFCGFSQGVEDYPKLYLPTLSGGSSKIFTSGICVKECPKHATNHTIECAPQDADACAEASKNTYDTKTVIGYCFPQVKYLKEERPDDYEKWIVAFEDMLTSNPAGRQMQDMYLSSRAIYSSFVLSFVYSITFIYLMSWLAEYIAWAVIILVQVGLTGAAVGFMGYYFQAKGNVDVSGATISTSGILGLGIMFTILALVFGLLICCGYNSLRLAINVVDASADFLAKTKRLIFVPVLYFFVTVIVFMIWMACLLCINSIGDIEASNGIVIQGRHAKKTPEEAKVVRYLFLFMLFGVLWIFSFIKAKSSFITMVAATTFYFDSNKEREGDAEVGLGFRFAYMYHAGSLAMGSFIIAVVQFIRIVFVYVAEQAQKASGENAAVKCIVGCANCCLACIDKIVEYINKSAYAYMAVSGDGFCTSAWNGFLLNIKHILQFGWANILAAGMIFIGKIAIVVGNIFSCYFIMKFVTKDLDEISSPIGPLVVVGFVSYICASVFLGLFDEAALAMMTCLAIDMDLSADGEPKYGPPTFHDKLEGMNTTSGDKDNKNALERGGWDKSNEIA